MRVKRMNNIINKIYNQINLNQMLIRIKLIKKIICNKMNKNKLKFHHNKILKKNQILIFIMNL